MKTATTTLLAAIVLIACAGNDSAPASSQAEPTATIEDLNWKVAKIGETRVSVMPNRRAPQLVLHSQNRQVAAFGGCNQLSGTYELNGAKLTLSRMATTMMACVEGMEQEQALHDALNRVARWKIHDDSLELMDIGGETVATLVPGEKSLN